MWYLFPHRVIEGFAISTVAVAVTVTGDYGFGSYLVLSLYLFG